MASSSKKKTEHYTYQDYLQWDDKHRWEIINGQAYCMSPAPSTLHQIVTGNIFTFLNNKLKGKKCRPFISPVDVVLSSENIVQPDVLVVCDPKKVTELRIEGAPDIIFEVLSPSNILKDRSEKRSLYEKFGVKEYIIVDFGEKFIEYYFLEEGKYQAPLIYQYKDFLVFKSLQGLKMPLKHFLEPPEHKKTWSPKIVKFT